MKNILKYILTFIILLMILSILLILSYSLPNGYIRENIEDSLPQLQFETAYFRPFFGKDVGLSRYGALDNFTDAILLNVALDKGKDQGFSIIQRAFLSYHYKPNNDNQVKNLSDALSSENTADSNYTRYWFGTEVILRPLLLLFNLAEIRYINMFFMFILFIIAFHNLSKKTKLKYGIAFAVSVIAINFFTIPMSLQYSPVMYIMLVDVIIILNLYDKDYFKKILPYNFIITGTLAAYFDLLTYPLITLGYPLIIILILNVTKNKASVKENIKTILMNSIMWGVAYVMAHISKWVISSMVSNENIFEFAIDELQYRLGSTSGNNKFTRADVIMMNMEVLFHNIFKIITILYTYIWIFMIIMFKDKNMKLVNIIPFLFVTIFPYIWYCIIPNHAYEHPWMTYKTQSIAIFGIISMSLMFIDFKNIKLNIKKD